MQPCLSYRITITGAERLAVTETIQWPDLQKIEPKLNYTYYHSSLNKSWSITHYSKQGRTSVSCMTSEILYTICTMCMGFNIHNWWVWVSPRLVCSMLRFVCTVRCTYVSPYAVAGTAGSAGHLYRAPLLPLHVPVVCCIVHLLHRASMSNRETTLE